ncbi:MAG: hypothetical protein K0S29_16 [Gammaproteobacteria bacterium]|jgi:hypothetical protein|nr:hypothetical protein [Gammaproteobacteria bacterium]
MPNTSANLAVLEKGESEEDVYTEGLLEYVETEPPFRPDSCFREQTFVGAIKELAQLQDSRAAFEKICCCFFGPSLQQVVEPYLEARIDAMKFEYLMNFYFQLQRVKARNPIEDSLLKATITVIVREANHCFDASEILRCLGRRAKNTEEELQARAVWNSYEPNDQICMPARIRELYPAR